MVDAGAIGGPIGTLGDDIEAGEQSQALVADQVHDVALAFLAQQLEGQQAAHRLGGRNHDGAGQSGLLKHLIQMEVPHQGHEQGNDRPRRVRKERGRRLRRRTSAATASSRMKMVGGHVPHRRGVARAQSLPHGAAGTAW